MLDRLAEVFIVFQVGSAVLLALSYFGTQSYKIRDNFASLLVGWAIIVVIGAVPYVLISYSF